VPQSLRTRERFRCRRFNRRVVSWLRANPQVHKLFVSQHSMAAEALVRPGRDEFHARVLGHIRAWRSLPSSVRHVIVIRDTPYTRFTVDGCVSQAIRDHARADLRCAVERTEALHRDAAAQAAKRLASPLVQTVDFTPFICDPQLCFPVVGGVLVYKDHGHLTRVFGHTLGPNLERAVDRILRRR
jgi:hypothetical protein